MKHGTGNQKTSFRKTNIFCNQIKNNKFCLLLLQECHTKSTMLHTISDPGENVSNSNGIDGNANDNLSMRFISMVQYRKQPILIGSPLDSMFGESDRSSASKVMRLGSCYKSKVSRVTVDCLVEINCS